MVIRPAISRSVAQSGSAPRSGRGGRRFKSCHSDQLPSRGVDLSQLSVSAIELGGDRVHKRVHRRVLRMVTLAQDSKGNYGPVSATPIGVREEYGRLYGPALRPSFRASQHQAAHRQSAISRMEGGGRGGIAAWCDRFIARHPVSDLQNGKTCATMFMRRCVRPLGMTNGNEIAPTACGERMRNSGKSSDPF